MNHQEYMQNNCRYLTGSEQNELQLKWNKEMHQLFKEMMHDSIPSIPYFSYCLEIL